MSGNSYVKYDQRFLYYLGLLITKKVILNSIVGVSLNEYNKGHTVVVAEKRAEKCFYREQLSPWFFSKGVPDWSACIDSHVIP